jgi:cobalt-zinc-cadmium efflux system outer membrane protein
VTLRGLAPLAALLAVVAARSAAGEVLTEARVLASAQKHYPVIVSAEADRRAAEGEREATEGAFDPLLKSRSTSALTGPYENLRTDAGIEQPTSLYGTSWYAGWRYGRGDYPVYDGNYATGPAGEVKLGASVPLLRNGAIDRRRATRERAERSVGMAEASVEAQRIATARSAASRYWDWVLAEERVRLARELLEIARFRRDATERRAKHGEIQSSEVLENERGLMQRRSMLASADRSREQALYELSLFVRGEDGQVVRDARWESPGFPAEGLSVPQREQALAKAEAQRPELRRLGLEAERERVEARFADNQTLVAADVGSALKVPIDGDQYGYKVPTAEVTLGLDFSPLNRAWRGKRIAAEAAVERLRVQLEFLRDRVRVEVDDAISAWRRASERVAAAAAEKELAQELARLERMRFDLGEGTLFLVNLREQVAFEAELRDREARSDLQKAVAQFRAAVGER